MVKSKKHKNVSFGSYLFELLLLLLFAWCCHWSLRLITSVFFLYGILIFFSVLPYKDNIFILFLIVIFDILVYFELFLFAGWF